MTLSLAQKQAQKKYRKSEKGKLTHNLRQKKYDKSHSQIIEEKRKKRKYKISNSDYDFLFDKQNGCCAICGKHQDSQKQSLCIDHNHITGEIRGLLCFGCNSALGNLRIDEFGNRYLIKAISYIR